MASASISWFGILILAGGLVVLAGFSFLVVYLIVKMCRGSKSCSEADQTVQELNREAEDLTKRVESVETIVMEKTE